MKSKGFTVLEMLVSIVIITIVGGIATYAILTSLEKSKGDADKIMERNLEDAALTYGLDKLFLKTCSVGFKPSSEQLTDPNDTTNSCTKLYKVSYFVDNGYFKDDKKYCDRDATIVIYNKANDQENGEYQVFVPKGTCKSK